MVLVGAEWDGRMLTEHQQQLRAKYLSAPLVGPPEPWRAMGGPWSYVPVGGLLGVGFGVHPETGDDLLMVVSVVDGGRVSGEPGATWWDIFNDERHGEFRAAGFSPSGRTLVVATSSDVTLFVRSLPRVRVHEL